MKEILNHSTMRTSLDYSEAGKARILVVDDEKDICDILQFNLENEGYTVTVAHSAEEALATLTAEYQLILLDVMMGGISGFKMAEQLREAENFVPILFLTAKNTENDMLTGFSSGGDDYVAKPFSIKEVLARVKAILKRGQAKSPEKKWSYKAMSVNTIDNKVMVDGKEVPLTKKELDILTLIIQASPSALSRNDILDKVWNQNEFVLDRTVDVHIARLRKKLGEYGSIIANRSGFGYYLNVEAP